MLFFRLTVMPKSRGLFLLLVLLVVQCIVAEETITNLENNQKKQDKEDSEINDIRSSAITIIEAPDLSQAKSHKSEDEDEDGISNDILLKKSQQAAIELVTSIPGRAWLKEFLANIGPDDVDNDEEIDLQLDDVEEPVVELTPDQKHGKHTNLYFSSILFRAKV